MSSEESTEAGKADQGNWKGKQIQLSLSFAIKKVVKVELKQVVFRSG